MLCAQRVSCGDKQQSVMMALYGFGRGRGGGRDVQNKSGKKNGRDRGEDRVSGKG